jgi:hypothetical protein
MNVKERGRGKRTIVKSHTSSVMLGAKAYLHPASLSRRAYIFPMSPMPINPTTASPMIAVCQIVSTVRCCPALEYEAVLMRAQKKQLIVANVEKV